VIPIVIHNGLKAEEGFNQMAEPLLLYLIARVQLINQRNESGSTKPYESSVRDLAEDCEISSHTTIQRSLKWLKEKGWLDIQQVKGKQKTCFLPNEQRINELIGEYYSRKNQETKPNYEYQEEEWTKNCTRLGRVHPVHS
jgi:DNA-binding transcriptional regulator YhcF (GntR family)